MLRNDTVHSHATARSGDGRHISTRLDHIGRNAVMASVERLHTADTDHARARARNIRAAGIEKVRNIDDMRLTRGVLKRGHALGEDGGEHDVDRRADRNDIKIDLIAAQAVLGRLDVQITRRAEVDPRAERLKAFDVLIDRARAEVTATRHTDLGLTETTEHRADQIRRAAHFADKLHRRHLLCHRARINEHSIGVDKPHLCTDHTKHLKRQRNIADVRHVADLANVTRGDRSEDHGECGVLHAADIHFTV